MKAPWKPDLDPEAARTYACILEALQKDLESGRLLPGDRLPTHRELAAHLGVAVGTITRAYREAERQGLIYGDGRRGTFVGGKAGQWDGHSALHPEQEPIDLSRFFPPAVNDPDLGEVLGGLATRRDVQHLLSYTRAPGWEHHRAAGAKWINSLGMKVNPDDVIMTSGAQHAIMTVLLARAEKGDSIAADEHIYPGIRFAAEKLGLEVVGIEADGEGILPDALAARCEAGPVRFLYCVPTFNNPTNSVLSGSRRHAIAETAEKYGFEIIEDEINRRLLPEALPLISSIVPDRSYLIAPVTKMMGGGVRICYLVAPERAREELVTTVHTTMLMVSPILAEIASVWINDGTADRVIAERRKENKRRNQVAEKILSGFQFTAWPTSYFIWLTLPETWQVASFAAEAQTQGVLVAPSCCFAVDESREANAVRICIGAAADHDTLQRALTALAQVLRGRSNIESIIL
jgi:DNA-binding transcriptional MocR family regulator